MVEQHSHTLTAACPGCSSTDTVKDGHVRGRPRRRCKTCGRRYQRTSPRGYSKEIKHQALKLYASGVSMNRTGQLLGISGQSVMRWVRSAGARAERQLPRQGRVVAIEPPGSSPGQG